MTALVAIPLLIFLIAFTPQPWFGGIVMVSAGWGLFEFYSICLPNQRRVEKVLAVISGSLLVWLPQWQESGLPWGIWTFLFVLAAILFLFRFQDLATVIEQLGLILFGFLYIPFLLGHLNLLVDLAAGRQWIFLTLMAIMVNDSAAYFVGSAFGRHRLYPAISPKKSWEGLVGGIAGSVAAVFFARAVFFPSLDLIDCLPLGLLLGVLGPVGDLFESMIKRSYGVKDSGFVIPGHGGLLDRLDSLLFSFPAVYYYAWLVVG
ncbi:MAG: phosphatidate cytidylyltransferase [Desulfuromonadaceae bacterium]|nr:phosphatidate cytidylyltransferase [Desulfuromonadaceae bacterium]